MCRLSLLTLPIIYGIRVLAVEPSPTAATTTFIQLNTLVATDAQTPGAPTAAAASPADNLAKFGQMVNVLGQVFSRPKYKSDITDATDGPRFC
jgi:hypothetical protein